MGTFYGIYIYTVYIYTGWCFGTCFKMFHILGIIIPTDELIFLRGVSQPPTRYTVTNRDGWSWSDFHGNMGGFTLIYSFSSASQLKKTELCNLNFHVWWSTSRNSRIVDASTRSNPHNRKKTGGKWREQKSCPEFNEVSAPRHLQKAQTIDNGWSVDWWWIKTSRCQMVMG